MTKRPNRKKNPPEDKRPRLLQNPQSMENETIVWHINTIDEEGEWGWRKLDITTFWKKIFETIKNFETMKWSDIKGYQNHSVRVSDICNKARKRLVDIGQDDTDELFSLRLSNAERIWGIRDGRVLRYSGGTLNIQCILLKQITININPL